MDYLEFIDYRENLKWDKMRHIERSWEVAARGRASSPERLLKERKLLKEEQLQQEKKERGRLFGLDERYAHERTHQAEKVKEKETCNTL